MKKNRTFDDFNEFSTKYRKIHDENLKLSGVNSDYFSEHKIQTLKKVEKEKDNISFLDFGCGDGNSAVFFNQYFQNSEYFGIDVSSDSILKLIKKINRTLSFNYSTVLKYLSLTIVLM